LVAAAASAVSALANRVDVAISGPYACGEATIGVDMYDWDWSKPEPHLDTVHFSNGLVVTPAWYHSTIPEEWYPWWGALMVLYDSCDSTGLRPQSSLIRQQIHPGNPRVTQTLAIADTIWDSSLRYPDSLWLLDSLRPSGSYVYAVGKWCFMAADTTIARPGWNGLFYVKALDGTRMKLQVHGHEVDTPASLQPAVRSLRLRWAVDSAGNGVFMPPLATHGHRAPTPALLRGPGRRLAGWTYDLFGRRRPASFMSQHAVRMVVDPTSRRLRVVDAVE